MKRLRFGKSPRKKILLINPKDPDSFWGMKGTVDAVGARALMPSNTLATLIGLTPDDVDVEYFYCDENLQSIDWALDLDLVAITGYTLHSDRIGRISRAWRERGVPVALGGAFATLNSEQAKKLCDHHFIGEGEYTWPQFLREFVAGNAKPLYKQKTRINMHDSPPPNWFFIDAGDYLYMTVQTSRGCPNRCDFCDAIQLVGRKHRRKTIDQIMVEISNAQQAGAETIFFSEDNFHVSEKTTKELLNRIIDWNTSLAHPVQFSCQTSMRIADNEEIVKLLADARFAAAFIGLESTRKECLEEVNKGQLYRDDAVERIKLLSSYGILPFLGMIVGFDHDDEETFKEIEGFLSETGSPIASLSVLNAPAGTPLYSRLDQQGRIDDNFAGFWHFSTNIKPLQWTLDELLRKHRGLFRRLYEPESFEQRTLTWLSNVRYFSTLYTKKRRTGSNLKKIARILYHYSFRVPPPVRTQFFRVLKKTWDMDPRLIRKAITIMTQYCHYYDFSRS